MFVLAHAAQAAGPQAAAMLGPPSALLDAKQVHRYAELRGYSASPNAAPAEPAQHPHKSHH